MVNLVDPIYGYYEWRPSDTHPYIGQFILKERRDYMEIWSVSISSENRGKGYGQKMIGEAINIARQKSLSKPLKLYVEKNNSRAIHVYEKCGFKTTGNYAGKVGAWTMTYMPTE